MPAGAKATPVAAPALAGIENYATAPARGPPMAAAKGGLQFGSAGKPAGKPAAESTPASRAPLEESWAAF